MSGIGFIDTLFYCTPVVDMFDTSYSLNDDRITATMESLNKLTSEQQVLEESKSSAADRRLITDIE
jgi:hypothetical protein